MFQYTTAIKKLRTMRGRKKPVQGGTSAGKTHGIIPVVIDTLIKNPRYKATIVAESIPAVKAGAVKIFKDVMFDTRRWVEDRWLGNPMQYTFANGSVVEFTSFDTIGKAKAAGKREILFLNECNHILYEIADALMIRTTKEIWLDFNPENEFWVHTELLPEPDVEMLVLTYEDNEACPPEIVVDIQTRIGKAFHNPAAPWSDRANIKSEYWANWCKVYVLGEIGSLQGTVFDFNIVPGVPLEAELVAHWLDFGYTIDPTAIGSLYRCNGELYLEEHIYERRLTNPDIAAKFTQLGFNKSSPIVADSAEPKSIAELQSLGWLNVEASEKGPDSIRHSIDTLQSYTLNVTADSLNLIKELRGYRWKQDASGKSTGAPMDGLPDHHIAGARYVALNKLNTYEVGIFDLR